MGEREENRTDISAIILARVSTFHLLSIIYARRGKNAFREVDQKTTTAAEDLRARKMRKMRNVLNNQTLVVFGT